MTFNSRQHAGQLLTEELKKGNVRPDLVYGLARGGVAVAAEIASAFKVPLEALVVRKISPPGNSEFALGAIATIDCHVAGAPRNDEKSFETGSIFVWWDKDTVRRLGLSADWQKRQIRDKKIEISDYLSKISFTEKASRSGSKLSNIVLVDDGAATGATMLAAIKGKKEEGRRKKENPKIVVALPVASSDAAAKIRQQADQTVILFVDPYFRAVGQYYREFGQVSWDEVKTLLQLNNESHPQNHPRKTSSKHDRSRIGDERGRLGADI